MGSLLNWDQTRWKFNGFMNPLLLIFSWQLRSVNIYVYPRWVERPEMRCVIDSFICWWICNDKQQRTGAATGSFYVHQLPLACRHGRRATQYGFWKNASVTLSPWQNVRVAYMQSPPVQETFSTAWRESNCRVLIPSRSCLISGVSPRKYGFDPLSLGYIWWNKWHWASFVFEYFGFPMSIIISLRVHILVDS